MEASPAISLADVCRSVHLRRHQQRKSCLAQESLIQHQVAAARAIRLSCAARSIQHTLAGCLRLDDRASFANLLCAFHDASDACFFPNDLDASEADAGSTLQPAFVDSFLDGLSSTSTGVVLDILSRVRYNAAFLTERLFCLTQKEMISLLPDRSYNPANDSIFGEVPRVHARKSNPLSLLVDSQMEVLSSQRFESALEALIYVPRSVTRADSREDELSVRIWAHVCARLIAGQKQGSERLVPAVWDIFAGMLPWPGRDRLEIWVLQTLRNGQFLLEPSTRKTFRDHLEARVEGPSEQEIRSEAFFTRAVESLLDLLSDTDDASVIPPGALRLCQAISEELSISPGHQNAFPSSVITRWLFGSFLLDIITTPEVSSA